MKVAIFGCLHGQLDDMFKAVEQHERQHDCKVDLIIVCGDCQTIRHQDDLKCLAVPNKYKRLGDFHEYYSGRKKIPTLTLFVGGNHEASNYLMTLPYGGWVCDNFYYLGFASVINYRGLRIGGVSGIYNYHSCNKGRFERLPLDDQTIRSIYHTRRLDIFRLQLLSKNIQKNNLIDIFISHDWPARIYDYGNLAQLLRFKPFFKEDIEKKDGLGSPLTQPLIHQLKPRRWFAAHLHCKFYAKVEHDNPKEHFTEFLSLNKIEGNRQFDEYIELTPNNTKNQEQTNDDLYYDLEWLTIIRKTIDLEINSRNNAPCPNLNDDSARTRFPSEDDMQETAEMMNRTGGLVIKRNFCMSEPVIYNRSSGQPASIDRGRSSYFPNPQHLEFCSRLKISDPILAECKDDQARSSHMKHRKNYRPHPNKKRALDLDEDGCLPFHIDKKGDLL